MKQCARLLLAISLCIAAAALSSTPAYAQGGRTSTSLSGTVTDASGAVIPGATIAVKNNATATEFHATSNESGSFTVPSVEPGSYTVTVTLMGFKTAVLNDVRINAGTPASVKVALEVGGLEETVVVEGGSEIIQTQSPAVTSTIDANQILKLPTGSRSALEFVTTLPGVNTPGGSRDSTVNGLPQSAINMTLDGVSVQDNHLKTTDGFFARVSPRLDAIEEVTVSTAAQDAASTGQGAVQIRFITRSGSNQFAGSSYYYMQHYKLNSNTWFNNRDLPPGPDGKAPKAEDVLYQPGTRVGGPIVIPGLFNGRDKAFFFVNYEESRSPGQNTANRNVLHPRAEQGWFRYTASGVTREVNVLALAAANGQLSTVDPTIGRLLGDIRSTFGQGGLADLTDPMLQRFSYQYETDNVTRYPTGRIDYNVSNNHRLTWSMNYTDLNSYPDTTNNREPKFPGFPATGPQISDRYTVQGTLRSTLGANLVNELRIGGSGGATLFQPNMSIDQHQGSFADQAGFLLNINRASGIQNAAQTGAYSAREASTKLVENTLNWLKGNHSIQTGFQFTQGDVWLENQLRVRTIDFGVDGADPANGMFTTTNFSGASNAQLTQARNLYAVLTGRITSITGELRLDENTDEYQFGGTGLQRARLRDWGFFVADTWRWKPNFTVNLGLRYELQQPFYPRNNSYSKATLADVWGRSGIGNLFQPGNLPGQPPVFTLYEEGEGAYNTDANNWAPSVGFAWTLGGTSNSLLGTVLGREEGDSVIRGGYTMGYNRPGMSDFTGAIDDNPGIALTATRNHALGNLGTPGSILLRNSADLGAPPGLPVTRVYPMSDVVTGDITIFDENLQVPYAMSWTAGWQRKLTADTVVEARYVGTRSLQSWQTYNYNEINIVENNFLNEFRQAQANLVANIAAGRGNTFAFTGVPGTAPLPIFLAHYNGQPAANAGDPARYTGGNWTSSTFLGFLAQFNPQPYSFASTNATNGLLGNATFRNNAAAAGLARNFWVANPDLIGGANVIGNGGYTKYNSLQLELRKRLSHGLQFNTSYVFGKGYISERYSLRTPRKPILDVGAEGTVDHAFKATWVYELPFGRGRRFGSNAGGFMDRVIGGWSLDGVARIQSGRLLDFGNVRLVGMSVSDVEDMFKLRFDDAGKAVFMLPQDVIDNTVRAFSVTPTGYSDQGAPTGRYFAPANGPDCIEVATGYGDCGINQLIVRGPWLYRFDLSTEKRIPIKGRVNFIFRAEFLNAFNTPWFTPVTGIGNDPDDYLVTGATSGRDIQLVFRVNW